MRARAGDPKAQFQLYESAPFAPGSLHWLRRAAEQGHREAQGELGWYYHTHARPRRPDLARRWWGLSAAQGDAEIQNVLGELLRDGAGVRRNYREAFRWFVAAARAGEPTAQLNPGWALYYGRGVRRDRRAALLWYRRAARRGACRHRAMYNIAQMYRRGHGVGRSERRAVEWYQRAAARGSVGAMVWLSRLLGNGREGDPGERAAVRWLRRAARLGDPEAQRELGVRYAEGRGVGKSPRRAAGLYRAAAEQGDPRSCHLLGGAYLSGLGVRRNTRVARYWLARAQALPRHPGGGDGGSWGRPVVVSPGGADWLPCEPSTASGAGVRWRRART